jgi:hypothetical protein
MVDEKKTDRLDLALLLQDEVELAMTLGGRELTIKYRPAALQDTHTLDEGLKACVVDFGLNGTDGKPVPATDAGLAALPWPLKRRIWQEILAAPYPN